MLSPTKRKLIAAGLACGVLLPAIAYQAQAASVPAEERPVSVPERANVDPRAMQDLPLVGAVLPHMSNEEISEVAPMAYWDRVAQCETKSNWTDGGNYSGGLGIARQAWINYGGRQFAKRPHDATKAEQIIVANRISVFGYQTTDTFETLADRQQNRPYFRNPVGYTGWGCIKNTVGKPYAKVYKGTRKLVPKGAGLCRELRPALLAAGFSKKAAHKAMYVAWRESRCIATAYNADDPAGGSRGLFQINGSWEGYLKEAGIIETLDDLYDPATNIKAAVEIWRYSRWKSGYGWLPWNA